MYSDYRDEDGWGYFNALKLAHPLFDKDIIFLRYILSVQVGIVNNNRTRIERLLWSLFHASIKVIPLKSEDHTKETTS